MQLDFFRTLLRRGRPIPVVPAAPAPPSDESGLLEKARTLLAGAGAELPRLTIRWNTRMRSTAGTAWPTKCLVNLNPRLREFGDAEVDRTLRHELAHLLAHHRAGRRRIAPHGAEWRQACRDLGLENETRCHTLPLPRRTQARPHAYRCPVCQLILRRVRPLRRKTACLACCRRHNRGAYDERFRFVRLSA